jgi:hypothetical protein
MTLKRTLSSLVPLLVDAIPQAVTGLKPSSPLCMIRIRYYDTHAPCTYLSLETVSAERRAQVVQGKGSDAPHVLWGLDEQCRDQEVMVPPEGPAGKRDKEIAALFEDVYQALAADEEKNMVRFRKMLWEVARKLNTMDWKNIAPTTDDFVLVPAEGSGSFRDDFDDIFKSIPAARLSLLISRGFLPDEWSRFDPKAAQAAYEAEEGAATLRELQKPGMVRCPNTKCGKAVPKEARRCPHCQGPGPSY